MRIFVGLLPLVLACGGAAEEERGSYTQSAARQQHREFVDGDVRLLSPGAEPRAAIRYEIAEGARERARLEVAFRRGADLERPEDAADAPVLSFDLDVGPAERVGARTRYELELRRGELPATLPAELVEEVQRVTQIDGYALVDERGITRDHSFEPPEQMPPRFQTMLGNIRTALGSVPFPEEAIGVGAEWEIRRPLDLASYAAEQSISYTLESIEEGRITVLVTVTQTAEPQPLRGLADGVRANLEAYEAGGEGRVVVDPTHLVPQAELHFASELEARAETGQALQLSVRATIRLAPRED